MKRIVITAMLLGSMAGGAFGQAIAARRLGPNLESNIDMPLRYRPDGGDFVIENGAEFFNRPLYGGNTAFRVDAGDKPEFSLYLPGRGGNLRLGIRSGAGAKWLSAAQRVTARYRPGGMIYDVRDPMLGAEGVLHIEAYALAVTEGLVVRVEGRGTAAGLELVWAYGGVNGQRGTRDGDIGTERVPISEYFQLTPAFCQGNVYETGEGSFTMKATAATIFGRVPGDAKPEVADARQWAAPATPNDLLGSVQAAPANQPVVVGHAALAAGEPRYLSLQRLGAVTTTELQTYRDVTASRPAEAAPVSRNVAAFAAADLPAVFADAATYFTGLRQRVMVDTPDAYLNAAVGALNVAADAVWDEPQKAIMHGAIAWRTKLLGWRGPYLLDDLGWHDRATENFAYWATRQNTGAIPAKLPAADEGATSLLSRNETGLHSNGDMSNSHYDMNLVHIDAAFRHILWTGDMEFARKEWPVIERHLAWEQRMFRRPFGAEKLPLYEAYAAIWASDDLQYGGGGAAHSTAYNYYHNKMAARVAKALGIDPAPYEKEAELIAKAMRQYLWLGDRGWFAEYRDYLGLQLAHPSAALWTVYHTMDSEVATPLEAWQMTRYVDTQMPHIPVRGAGVPAGYWSMCPTSTWMPYFWSINNVCMNENNATALAYYQAGRGEEGTRLLTSGVLASMYMGISPGNVGTMNYLDVYRRESQRDFGDGSGTLSRTVVEGLFGLRPDALAGVLNIVPGFPEKWDHASIRHPDAGFTWKRTGQTDAFMIEARFAKPMALRLEWPAYAEDIASLTVNGQPAQWAQPDDAVGTPRVIITAPAAAKWDLSIAWKGAALARQVPAPQSSVGSPIKVQFAAGTHMDIGMTGVGVVNPQHALVELVPSQAPAGFSARVASVAGSHTVFVRLSQGAFTWWMPYDFDVTAPAPAAPPFDWSKPDPATKFETVDLAKLYNDRVTQIFKNEYRTPRSPWVSLALPKQGIGAWAGEATLTAAIDDTGLRAAATKNGGKILMPNGAPFATPGTGTDRNIIYTSQWDNYPREVKVPVAGKARRVLLLLAGSTNPMQSRFDNGEVVVTYTDGTTARLALENPTTWWPIEQDYFIDDYQFRRPGPMPPRVNLRTAEIRLLDPVTAKGKGGRIDGGAATVLDLALDPQKELQSLTVRALANDVVIGLMSATLVR